MNEEISSSRLPAAPSNLPPIPLGWVLLGYHDRVKAKLDELGMESVYSAYFNPLRALQDWSIPSAQHYPIDGQSWWITTEDSAFARAMAVDVDFYQDAMRRTQEQSSAGSCDTTPVNNPVELRSNEMEKPHSNILSVNGVCVSSYEELQTIAAPLMAGEETESTLKALWRSLEYDDPEPHVSELVNTEPVLLGVVEFHPIEEEDVLDVATIAESTRSVSEIITRAAAGALLRGGLSNHFYYTEGGVLRINPVNPPTIDQANEIIGRTLEIRHTAQRLDNYSAWTLGMLGDQLETFFGDEFDPSVVMEASKKTYNTYITAVGTYRALWNEKRPTLSFTHHKEVYYSKIDADQKNWVLDKAAELDLSVADTRKLISYVKNYGIEGINEDLPETSEELIERIEVKSVNRNYLFFLSSENKWFEYRGPFEHIPNGASPIFNADTRAKLETNGEARKLATWTPVGTELPYVRGHAAINARGREAAAESDEEVETSHAGGRGRNPNVETHFPDSNPGEDDDDWVEREDNDDDWLEREEAGGTDDPPENTLIVNVDELDDAPSQESSSEETNNNL